ncbi:VRR-NUC domain-containing protein [Paracoccus sp. NSM]|uniref:VRR-NUC domain-containing protein n=1 Tax=Paracoccus sp. NSM TaxID=3457784 RepID=UPI004036F968
MTARMTAADLIAMQAKARRPKRVDREGPIHREILAHLRAVLPAGSIVHHSANAIGLSGALIQRQIAHNEAMGTVKGFPDLLCILPGPRVWLFEVKAPGNSPDKDQRALHADLRALGARVAVVRSTVEVDAAITEWNAAEAPRWRPNDYRDLRDRIVGEGTDT